MNVVVLVGRLTRPPECRYSQTGTAICSFDIAVDRLKIGDKKETDFIPIVVFGKSGEACANNLDKGRLVGVQGRMQVRQYEKDGQKRRVTEVIADTVQFLDKAKQTSDDTFPD